MSSVKLTNTLAIAVVVLVFLPSNEANAQYPSVIDLDQTTAEIEVYGAGVAHYSGTPLCSGDIDGDGLSDLLIVSRGAEPLGGTRSGELDILWGWGLGDGTVDLAPENASISRIFGRSSDYPMGVLTAGDFNNDGYDDIIFGQPFSPSLSGDGIAYVIFGAADFPDTLDLQANPANVITLLGPWSWQGALGYGVSAGDLNGDGYDEIIVSAPALDYSEVYIIHGGETFQAVYDMDDHQAGMTRIVEDQVAMYTGSALACGDVDGDGFDDLLIATEAWGTLTKGSVVLLYGESGFPDTLSLKDPAYRTMTIFDEPELPGRFGQKLTVADIDGNQALDLLVAAPVADPHGCRDCGEVYVFFNYGFPDTLYAGSTEQPTARIIGEWWWANCGEYLLCADLTGDGCSEIILPNVDSNPERTFIVYGGEGFPDTTYLEIDTLVTSIVARNDDEGLGQGLAAADFSTDGVMDLAIGAGFANPIGRGSAGTTYVLYGIASASGIEPPLVPPVFLKQNYPNPFSETTTIGYSGHTGKEATLFICDVLGRPVKTLDHLFPRQETLELIWDGTDNRGRRVPSGVYYYYLRVGDAATSKKMILVR